MGCKGAGVVVLEVTIPCHDPGKESLQALENNPRSYSAARAFWIAGQGDHREASAKVKGTKEHL